ncbi:MAG: hypothetical protein D6712_17760 [Chloroflexi bacterium]|nr:MAG: hypothetical protein D6712_17760 [Chloroflexota bacterium]
MISLADQIAEVKRELQHRKKVYSRWVNSGKMPARTARRQYDRLDAVLNTLLQLKKMEDLCGQ